jgi:hypothetical protein
MIVETKFMTVCTADLSGVGRSEQGDLFIVFKSGATHHVKYNDVKECDADHQKLSDAIKTFNSPQLPDGPQLVD